MSAAMMTERRAAAALPRLKARMAAIFYLLEVVTAFFGQFFVRGRLVVSGDAAATAHNVLGHESLFQLGFTAALLAVAFHLTYTVLFYDLLRPVNRSVALLAAFVSLVAGALQTFSSLFYLAPLSVLGGSEYLHVFTGEQVQALALLLLTMNAQAFNIYLVFFGFFLILTGYLMFKATFLPWIIGALLALAGLGYVTLLSPPLAHALYPFYLAPAAVGEPVLWVWLLVVGVNVPRWKEQASEA